MTVEGTHSGAPPTATHLVFLGTAFAIPHTEVALVSAAHLFTNEGSLWIRDSSGSWQRGVLKGVAAQADIAVVVCPGFRSSLRGLEIGEQPRPGAAALTYAWPQHCEQPVVCSGVVQAVNQWFPALGADHRFRVLHLGFAALPGMSGGPVVDEHGSAVGMLVKKYEDSGALALPIKHVVDVAEILLEHGKWSAPVLGISLREEGHGPLESDPRLVVTGVRLGGPAAAAGLQAGDVILEAAGTRISRSVELAEKLSGRPGAVTPLRLRGTDGKERNARDRKSVV